MFHLVRQVGNTLYVAANGSPTATGVHRELRFLAFNLNLDPTGSGAVEDNPSGMLAEPTDIEVDANGNAYICGTFEKSGPAWRTFLRRVPSGGNGFFDIFVGDEITTHTKPGIQTYGIIAILIGMMTADGPELRSYSPTGTLNWTLGRALPTGVWGPESIIIEYDVDFCQGWMTQEGSSASDLDVIVRMVHPVTGQGTVIDTIDPGVGIVSPRDAASGLPTGKRFNVLVDFGPAGDSHRRAATYSYDAIGNLTGSFNGSGTDHAWGLFVDQFGEMGLGLVENQNLAGSIKFVKLNTNNVPRFGFGLAGAGFLLPYIEQDNVFEPKSGDIAVLLEDGVKFSLTCIQQAPVALSDYYQPRSGRFFRPVNPVTFNDRYAGGAVISISQQPAHGTLTMGANGVFNYTSAQGYVGLDSFKYTLTKPGLNPSTGTVNLNVRP